jgi:tetratricopeptide (TPR) repeat protein
MTLDASAQRDLIEALRLLNEGKATEAAIIVTGVFERHPESVDAAHLLALCQKRLGNFSAAITAFQSAQRLDPLNATIAGNLANLLSQMGDRQRSVDTYLRALELNPDSPELLLNLGLTLLEQGKSEEAIDAFTAAIKKNGAMASLWHGLGVALRMQGDLEQASAALERAIKLDPKNGKTWAALGVIARLRGNPSLALQCYEQARRADFVAVELLDAEASAHFDLGDISKAIGKVDELLSYSPEYVPAHAMRYEMLFEQGSPIDEALAPFRQAIENFPENSALQTAFASALFSSGRHDETLRLVNELRARSDEPALAALHVQTLLKLRLPDEALKVLARSPKAWLEQPRLAEALAKALIAHQDPARASAVLDDALLKTPLDQALLATQSIAWRLLDDPREHWLCDYDQLIWRIKLRDDHLAALEEYLRSIHLTQREPLRQSLRNGTQTSGNLLGRNIDVLNQTSAAIVTALVTYLDALPKNDRHPFLARRSEAIRFAGSWSVLLKDGGKHVNHFHQEGWISSAYYISLPMKSADDPTAGCLQFGQPSDEYGVTLAPRKVIEPVAGELVLFPSYIWHGTVPFHGRDSRLTIAFDVVPGR